MRRVPLFLRVAVVCSSLTLLVGFVAWKSRSYAGESEPEPNRVMMPSTKSAPADWLDSSYATADDAVDAEVPAATEAVTLTPEQLRAFSSKSTVPAVEMDQLEKSLSGMAPPESGTPSTDKTAPSKPLMMSGTKRAEVFDGKFPVKPAAVAPDQRPPAPPTLLPGSKSLSPVIEVPPPPQSKVAPQVSQGKGG